MDYADSYVDSYPPAQTVCDGDEDIPTVTVVYEGEPKTDYEVAYVTYNTWLTIWVGYVSWLSPIDLVW